MNFLPCLPFFSCVSVEAGVRYYRIFHLIWSNKEHFKGYNNIDILDVWDHCLRRRTRCDMREATSTSYWQSKSDSDTESWGEERIANSLRFYVISHLSRLVIPSGQVTFLVDYIQIPYIYIKMYELRHSASSCLAIADVLMNQNARSYFVVYSTYQAISLIDQASSLYVTTALVLHPIFFLYLKKF